MTLDDLDPSAIQSHGSLADGIYVALRDWIADGSLKPGSRLREADIAARFDVSTTPVREALQRLEYDGLVTNSPRRGASVASVEWEEIHSILVVRGVLEVYAVRRVAETSYLHDFGAIRDILTQQGQAVHEGNRREASRLDREFHMSIISLTGNEPLVRFTELVHTQLQQARSRVPDPPKESMVKSSAEHQAVLAAIQAGQEDKAEEAAHQHVQTAIDTIGESVAESISDES